MNRIQTRWFEKHTQQAVTSRLASIPITAKTGPTAKAGRTMSAQKQSDNVFIVGESEVGGPDKVKGTP